MDGEPSSPSVLSTDSRQENLDPAGPEDLSPEPSEGQGWGASVNRRRRLIPSVFDFLLISKWRDVGQCFLWLPGNIANYYHLIETRGNAYSPIFTLYLKLSCKFETRGKTYISHQLASSQSHQKDLYTWLIGTSMLLQELNHHGPVTCTGSN
jgi:hypothetical protein